MKNKINSWVVLGSLMVFMNSMGFTSVAFAEDAAKEKVESKSNDVKPNAEKSVKKSKKHSKKTSSDASNQLTSAEKNAQESMGTGVKKVK